VVLERHWLEETKPDFSFHEKVQLYAYKIGASRKGAYVKLQIETPSRTLKNGLGIGRSVTYEFMRKQYRLTVLDIRPDAKRAQIRIHKVASAKDTAKAKDLINHWIEEIRPDFSFHDQVKLFAETIKAARKGSYIKLEIETPSQSIKKTLKIGQSTTFDFMHNPYRLTLLDIHPDQRRARISIKGQR
jgi:tRNA threonylcarbamoyladenosine modification (KEOPS) complex  Pcc1 subunit